ncbi:MAG TPA: type VI secretion system accessory protein TagJ [Bryobacteraceae bacterium]|jgi:type VI secretion system protein ImpE|nr:type VI secretion system accessory protein TagJ [Bryobacteraceae bacterium]
MTAKQLFDAGQVREAEKALSAYLRDRPLDAAQRTFLFELLCFSGQYDRAEKQLGVLAKGTGESELGAVLYYSALHAEKIRHELFQKQAYPRTPAADSSPGTLNGKPFQSIRDADPEIGPRLEIFAAGAYLWIPFEHIASIEMEAPRRLRDTLWAPALVRTGPSFKGTELGEVLIPVIYPFSWKNSDETVWLGRATDWVADDAGNEFPCGQKLFLVDGEEVPLLEVRSLQFRSGQAAAS